MASAARQVGFNQTVSSGLNFNWVIVTTCEGKRQLHMQWSPKVAAKMEAGSDAARTAQLLMFPAPQGMASGFARTAQL